MAGSAKQCRLPFKTCNKQKHLKTVQNVFEINTVDMVSRDFYGWENELFDPRSLSFINKDFMQSFLCAAI